MNHVVITSLCPLLIWLVLVVFFLSICFAVQDGMTRLKRLHQIPCSRCAFFTGNYHLKCTVHPCRALSEEAIDCLDYEPIALRQQRQVVFGFRVCGSDKAVGQLLTAVNPLTSHE